MRSPDNSLVPSASCSARLGSGVCAWLRAVLLGLIRAYQVLVSPLLGNHCRFVPSCSAYAAGAIRHHGLTAGTGLAVRRLLRCHPWHPGGWDPVA